MKSFYSYLIKVDEQRYFDERQRETEFMIERVQSKMKKRRKEFAHKKQFSLVSTFLVMAVFSITVSSLTFNLFADDTNVELGKAPALGYCVITDLEKFSHEMQLAQNAEKLQFLKVDTTNNSIEKDFSTAKTEAYVEKVMLQVASIKEKPLKHNAKNNIDISLIQREYTNNRIQYVESTDLGIDISGVSLPSDHQEYLYLLCDEYNMDFIKALGVSKHESDYDVYATGKNIKDGVVVSVDRGYFQLNSKYSKKYAENFNLPHAPYNPYVNMEIGVRILSDYYRTFRNEGLTGIELDEAVFSSYNRGKNGYRRFGVKEDYVARVSHALSTINN